MAQKLVWENIENKDLIYVAMGVVSVKCDNGSIRTHNVALRIDAREGRSALRTDMCNGFGPWEAIDDGAPQKALISAKMLAKHWLEAANAQQTMHPHNWR